MQRKLAVLAPLIVLLGVARPAAAAGTDTTVTVRSGTRLVIDNFSGDIETKTWSKNAVRIEADHSRRVRLEIDQSPGALELRAINRNPGPPTVDYELTVPAWMALEFSGVNTSVSIEGNHKGAIEVETVNGYIDVVGGAGDVELTSVNGPVTLRGATGRVNVSAVNENIHITDVTGEVNVDGVNGDIVLDRIGSKLVEASTVQGSIVYAGAVTTGGDYMFSTHQGDLTIGLPEKVGVDVSVATYGGDFSSFFPIQISQSKHTKKGQRFSFTTGDAGARIELNAFQGSIRIERAQVVKDMAQKMLTDPHGHDDDDEDDEGDEHDEYDKHDKHDKNDKRDK